MFAWRSHPIHTHKPTHTQPLTFGESIAAGLCLTANLLALTERWYRGGAEVSGGVYVCVYCVCHVWLAC